VKAEIVPQVEFEYLHVAWAPPTVTTTATTEIDKRIQDTAT